MRMCYKANAPGNIPAAIKKFFSLFSSSLSRSQHRGKCNMLSGNKKTEQTFLITVCISLDFFPLHPIGDDCIVHKILYCRMTE